MSQVQKTETREERRVTREYYTDSNQDVPSSRNTGWGSNQLNNFSTNNTLDDFTSQPWPSNSNSNPSQQNWTTNNTSSTTTRSNRTTTSDLFDEARNSAKNFFNPSNTSTNQSQNNSTRKTVNTTNKTFSSNLFDDTQRNNTSDFFNPSSSSSSPSTRHDVQNFKNNRPTMNSRNTNNTSKNTLEEQLNSKEMKTCKVEDIWKVESTRYWMNIPIGSQFGPDDVKITMKSGIMTVVVQKEKFSQYNGQSLGFEGFAKSFSVPHDADFQGIKSTFTADGNLRIDVPKKRS